MEQSLFQPAAFINYHRQKNIAVRPQSWKSLVNILIAVSFQAIKRAKIDKKWLMM
jgi:hypothetical protein